MSLPAAQQRILDGIADRLRRTEPRLTAKYAMFTRLCGNDGPPMREQLSQGRAGHLLAALKARLARRPTARPRRTWRRVLIASQVAVAIVLLSVLVGMSIRPPTTCGKPRRPQPMADARMWCPPQPAAGGLLGK